MQSKYLLVDKTILPDCFEKVIEARNLVTSGRVKDVSEAVKAVGISRSTYYKYKDYVFVTNTDTECRKAVISFSLSHKAGVLGEVLGVLSRLQANILTITQNMPVNSRAHVVLSMDISHMTCDIDTTIITLNRMDGVSNTKLIAIE